MAHRFNPEHRDRLMSDDRRKILSAQDVVRFLGVDGSVSIADVGVGPGYFAIPAAKSTTGRVYGVDVSSRMLDALQEHASNEGVGNIEVLEGDAQAIPLHDGAVDRALCAFVLHEVDDLHQAVSELKRITKPGGKIGVIEWEKRETEQGPPVSDRLSKDDLRQAFAQVHLHDAEEFQLNPNHYMLTFVN